VNQYVIYQYVNVLFNLINYVE